jgi:hypothetical protein
MPKQNLLVFLGNRFCWEKPSQPNEDGVHMHQRVHAGVYFSHVKRVRTNGIHHPKNHSHVLSLLAVHGDIEGEIHLLFSGGKAICLHVEKVLCHLKDLHEPWWTHQKPYHSAALAA